MLHTRPSLVTSKGRLIKILPGMLRSSKFADIRCLHCTTILLNRLTWGNSTLTSVNSVMVSHFFPNPSMDLPVRGMFFASRYFGQPQLLTQSKIKVAVSCAGVFCMQLMFVFTSGKHAFSWAVMPHLGHFFESDVPVAAYIFNSPLHGRCLSCCVVRANIHKILRTSPLHPKQCRGTIASHLENSFRSPWCFQCFLRNC